MRSSRVLREQRENVLSSCVKLNLNNPDSVEIAGLLGYSAVWVCMEHGSASWNDISHLVRAGKVHDVDVIVRVSKGSYSDYVKAFECDAAAIMVPHVTSAKEAASVVEMCRFQPVGRRALDGGNADGAYTLSSQKDYLKNGNREKFIVLQVESPEGLEAVEDIAAVPGYEVLMFGPGDFTHRIGKVTGDPAPEVDAARKRVEAATKKFGKIGFGVGVQGTPQEIQARGYGIVNLGADVCALASVWGTALQELRGAAIRSASLGRRALRSVTAMVAFAISAGSFFPLCGSAAAAEGRVIDLRKPVGESLKPDGFYWAFDEGLLGEGQPSEVDDLSGNGFVGRIVKSPGKPPITYAEGKFGTGIYAQGLGDVVEWTEKSPVNAATEPARLTMKDQSFTGGFWLKMDDRRAGLQAPIRQSEGPAGWRFCLLKEIDKGVTPDADKDLSTQSPGDTWFLYLEIGDSRQRGLSTIPTAAFADGKWHHLGFSVGSEKAGEAASDTREFSVTYWLDGEVFETVRFQAVLTDPEPETRSLRAGFRVWGVLDDAFVTTGVHSFKN